MYDLQVIEIRDILPVVRAEILPGVIPRTLRVRGRDFSNADEVLINEQKSPSVVIVSARELLAQVPEGMVNGPVRTIVVISGRLTQTERSKIKFRLGDATKAVAGIERMIQMFLKLLLQNPGSDIFSPRTGGGLLAAVGRMSGSASNPAASVAADLQVSVDRASKQMIAIQANDSAIALTERLLFARLLTSRFVVAEQALVGSIQLGNQAGQAPTVGMVI